MNGQDCEVTVKLPEAVAKYIRDLGIDIESKVIDLILKELNLNPEEKIGIHVELAVKFLKDGERLVDEVPVQASEKLYKATEECVKALAMHFRFEKILKKVEDKSRWTVAELERAVEAISDRVGKWFEEAWDRAWSLHVWGFHEAKLDSEAIRRRLPYVARVVEETRKIIGYAIN